MTNYLLYRRMSKHLFSLQLWIMSHVGVDTKDGNS